LNDIFQTPILTGKQGIEKTDGGRQANLKAKLMAPIIKRTAGITVQKNDSVKSFKNYFKVALARFPFLYFPKPASYPSDNSTVFPSIKHLSYRAAIICMPVRG